MKVIVIVFILSWLKYKQSNNNYRGDKHMKRLVNFIVTGLGAAFLAPLLFKALNFTVWWLGEFPEKWSKPLINSLGAPAGALICSVIILMLMALILAIVLGVMALILYPFLNFFIASEGFPWRYVKAGECIRTNGDTVHLERDTWVWWPPILRAQIRARIC